MKHNQKHSISCITRCINTEPPQTTGTRRNVYKAILTFCAAKTTRAAQAAAILAIFLAVLASPAMSMSVTPITIDMTTVGSKARSQISVFNNGAKPLPVEIQISRIELDENGKRTATPADDDFSVAPWQMLIAPGATQIFRLQWSGDAQISTSKHYVFSVNQVPVTMPSGQSGVQMVFNFETYVNIAPPNGAADITLLGTGVSKDDKGKTRPELRVKNPGNSYAKLTDATIKLSGGSWSKTLSPGILRNKMGMGLLQPGKTRRFLLPVEVPNGVSEITASVEYKPRK